MMYSPKQKLPQVNAEPSVKRPRDAVPLRMAYHEQQETMNRKRLNFCLEEVSVSLPPL